MPDLSISHIYFFILIHSITVKIISKAGQLFKTTIVAELHSLLIEVASSSQLRFLSLSPLFISSNHQIISAIFDYSLCFFYICFQIFLSRNPFLFCTFWLFPQLLGTAVSKIQLYCQYQLTLILDSLPFCPIIVI